MSPDRVALDHLMAGRAALASEIERLTAAAADLDDVINRLRADGRAEPGEPDPVVRPAQPPRSRTTPRTAPTGRNGKSIRSRVLDMLAAEDRDFPLTEIIERVRSAGIRAHDDAVRSITVKLMREGQVERVGRGQYRLVRPEMDETAKTAETAEPPEMVETPHPTSAPQVVEPDRYTPPLNLTQPWAGSTP